MGERFFSVAQEIRNRVWPDFWFLSDGNESLGNRLKYTSCTTLTRRNGRPATGREGLNADAHKDLRDVACYAPDSFFVSGAASPPRGTRWCTAPTRRTTGIPECPAPPRKSSGSPRRTTAGYRKVHRRPCAISSACQFFTGRACGGASCQSKAIATWAPASWACIRTTPGLAMQAVTFNMPSRKSAITAARSSTGGSTSTTTSSPRQTGVHVETARPERPGSFARHLQFRVGHVAPEARTSDFHGPRSDGANAVHARHGPAQGRQVARAREANRRCVARCLCHNLGAASGALGSPGQDADCPGAFRLQGQTAGGDLAEALADCRVLIVGPRSVMGNMPAEQETLRQFARAADACWSCRRRKMAFCRRILLEKRNFSSMGLSAHPLIRSCRVSRTWTSRCGTGRPKCLVT